MNSRFLISTLCLGAIVLACGPRARSEVANTKKSKATVATAESTLRQQGAPAAPRKTAKNAKTPVSAQVSVSAMESAFRLSLLVVNTSKKRVELTFPSGQTHDFVILDSLGKEVWRWGKGRMFTQTLRNRLLSSGESLVVDETWTPSALPAGRYVARATLTSQNYPLVQQTEFTVNGTTLASR